MAVSISIVSILGLGVFANSYLVKYNFGSNFGQVFFDYSGNRNHGQNGINLSEDSFDTIPTDRGAYSDGTKYIKLPPNEQVSAPLSIGSTYSISLWYYPYSDSDIFITYRIRGTYFSIIKYSNMVNLCVKFRYSDGVNLPMQCGGTIIDEYWNLIVLTNSVITDIGQTMMVYTTSTVVELIVSQPSIYSETGTGSHYIGYSSNSFKGFIWNYYIFLDIINPDDFYSLLSGSYYCRVPNCQTNCTPRLKDETGLFCLSIEYSPQNSGTGNNCNSCKYGCNDNTCFNCDNCLLKSCEISGNNVVCVCPGGTGTTSDCICQGDSETVAGFKECDECYEECSICESKYNCTDCIDSNAIPSLNFGCECKSGFYNETSLITEDACLPCSPDCKNCSSKNTCTECFDSNAQIQEGGCLCKDGFYNNSQLSVNELCLKCFSECKTCLGPLTCILCIDSNAEPQESGGCLCKEGFFNTSLLINEGECKVQACSDPNSLETVNHECECIEGYFDSSNTSEIICIKCPEDCNSCENYTNCIRCNFGKMNIVNGACKCPINSQVVENDCKADDGFYLDYSFDLGYYTEMCYLNCKACHFEGFDNCTKCYSGFKLIDGQCIECPLLCIECYNNLCTSCVEKAEINNKNCSCIIGFEKLGNLCKEKYFDVSMTILDKNYVKIIFAEKIVEALSLKNFTFSVKGRDDFKVKMLKEIKKSEYLFSLTFFKSLSEGKELEVEIMPKIVYSENNSQLKKYKLVGSLKSFTVVKLDPLTEVLLDSAASSSKTVVSSSLGASIISNPSAAWALLNTIQIIGFIPLSSAPLTNNTREFLISFSSYNIIPNPMAYIINEKITSEPYSEAREYNIETSVFLINIGPSFAFFIVTIFLWFILYLRSKCIQGEIKAKIKKILGNYKYSFFIRFWIQMYLEIGVYGIVQLKSDPSPSFLAYLNLILAVFCIIGFVLTIPLLLVATYISSSSISGNSQEFFNKWGSLYIEFKNDRGYWSSQFYFIYFIRRLAFVLSQIYLNHLHYFQTLLNASFSFIVLLHLIIYRPFKDRAIMFSNFIGEVCILIVMVLCCLFNWEIKENVQELVEIFIMFIVFGSMGLQLLISFYCFGHSMKIMWNKIVKERSLEFVKNATAQEHEPRT